MSESFIYADKYLLKGGIFLNFGYNCYRYPKNLAAFTRAACRFQGMFKDTICFLTLTGWSFFTWQYLEA